MLKILNYHAIFFLTIMPTYKEDNKTRRFTEKKKKKENKTSMLCYHRYFYALQKIESEKELNQKKITIQNGY